MDTVQDIILGQHKEAAKFRGKATGKRKEKKKITIHLIIFSVYHKLTKREIFFFSLFLTGSPPHKCGFQKGYA